MRPIKLSPKLTPRLLISPQLKQALCLLQLPLPELKSYLKDKISECPLLLPPRGKDPKKEAESLVYSNAEPYFSGGEDPDEARTQTSWLEKTTGGSRCLQDYLQHQLRMTFLNENELKAAEEIIAFIDENGYLRADLKKLSFQSGCSAQEMQIALETMQSLEPSGVGARNLQECLLIQLRNNEQGGSLAYKIVESCFKELSRKKHILIAKKLKASLEAVKEAVRAIISLNPKPAAGFSQEKTITIMPDAIIKKNKNGLKVVLNYEGLPKLKINNHYKKLLNHPSTPEQVKQFIKEKLKDALWLIKAVEQRQKNVIKIIRQIAKIQKKAFITDASNVKPLTLNDIAEKTGLHLSTVARIVSNKYVSTPQGTIRLKYFFGRKYISRNGELYSDKNILKKIRDIISNEAEQNRLSDQKISLLLAQEGIPVARRTIAKYRNKLKIPPAFLR